jgi:hypothetical protein
VETRFLDFRIQRVEATHARGIPVARVIATCGRTAC